MKLAGWLLFFLLAGGVFFLSSGKEGDGMAALCADCLLPETGQMLPPLAAPPPRPPAFVKLDLPYPAPPAPDTWQTLTAPQRVADARSRVLPLLEKELAQNGLAMGSPVYLRLFKETRQMELWLHAAATGWHLFRTYPVAAMSGQLGPKLKEGDGQAPEGFYKVPLKALNPASTYHLSFNLGYPNAYDAYHGRTGSFLMVHGGSVSIGCYAMTDPVIEEIYLLVLAALEKGQTAVPVHAFPFRMTPERLQQAAATAEEKPHLAFWQELLPAYTAFEKTKQVPQVELRRGRYALPD